MDFKHNYLGDRDMVCGRKIIIVLCKITFTRIKQYHVDNCIFKCITS